MDGPSRERIARLIASLREDPYRPGTKPLKDPAGRRAARVGGWRVIYFFDGAAKNVHVDLIGPRGEVYRDL
jgi:mRNA-degrading endonuclease RelE of RelBE toxin-antitoxin system